MSRGDLGFIEGRIHTSGRIPAAGLSRDLEWIEGPEVGRLGGLKPGDLSKDDIYADIATELMPGLRPGRERDEERTVMTHMGMPALDAAVPALVYDLAIDAGAGTWIRVF